MENGKEIFLGFRAVKEVLKQLWKEKKKRWFGEFFFLVSSLLLLLILLSALGRVYLLLCFLVFLLLNEEKWDVEGCVKKIPLRYPKGRPKISPLCSFLPGFASELIPNSM